MSELVIRKAEPRDIDDMTTIDEKCFSMPWSRESFERELIENKVALYIVAEIEGRVVGYMGLWRVVDEGHITNVAVAPDYRRRNIADALLQVMFEVAGNDGIIDYTLEVRVGNVAAQNLYKKYGFKGVGLREKYYSDDNEDALIMWKMGRTQK